MESMPVPNSPYSRAIDAAVGYFELGMIGEALTEIQKLPARWRYESEALELEAAIAQQTGQWELAVAALERLCSQHDQDVDQFIAWGCCLYELGRIEDCRSALRKAPPTAASRHALWHFHLACYESILGAKSVARPLILKALELEPRLRRMAEVNENLIPLVADSSSTE